MPYSITFVGVNGVGKSTNLSKVCFWLIQNGMKVLIAACDTFRSVLPILFEVLPLKSDRPCRSGAVEQLRVHVRNLSMLGVDGPTGSKGRVELYERGYGKDAAGIAKEAITYARDNDFDVVLIDTAGRMQDNEARPPVLVVPPTADRVSVQTALDACTGQTCCRQLPGQDLVRWGSFGWQRSS